MTQPTEPQQPVAGENAGAAATMGLPRLLTGAAALVLSLAMSAALVLQHFGGLWLPGCGPGSACEQAARSVWGSLPGLRWPVSHVGAAYFLALLVVWLRSRLGLSGSLRNLVRAGALVSVGYVLIMFVEGHVCPYCIGVHVGNFIFWFVAEQSRISTLAPPRLGLVAAVFAATTAALAGIEYSVRQAVERKAEADLEKSTAQIIEQVQKQRPPETLPAGAPATATATTAPASAQAATLPAAPSAPTTQPVPQTAQAPTQPSSAPASTFETSFAGEVAELEEYLRDGFRGRYLLGPEQAPVRIVIFTDYQCQDCQRIEGELRVLLQQFPDVSLSVKQFPFDQKCNPTLDRTLHPNACWAARAAEAAGILWGNDGFWKMHHWLFDKKGTFTTTEELEAGIRSLGYDPAGFVEVMTGPETLARVQRDIREARLLGLWQTPMIFINGVELRGWQARNALTRAVQKVLAANPPARDHSQDRPPPALEKCVGDWRENVIRNLPPDSHPRRLGDPSAPVRVVVFGDYQESTTAEVDAFFRQWVATHSNTQYSFRHFPFNQECNPHLPRTQHERACWAARVAEAAYQLGGSEAFWRVHAWLLSNQQSLTEDALRQAGPQLSVDVEALLSKMTLPDVEAAVREDADAANSLQLNTIPTIFVNNRAVQRWRWMGEQKGREILEAILKAAAAGQ